MIEYLQSWKKTLIVVSHDQHFMNAICTDTIHCFNQKLTTYKDCSWDDFKRKFLASQTIAINAFEKQKRTIKSGAKPKVIVERPPKDYEVCFNFHREL